jgi:hypothetical protein
MQFFETKLSDKTPDEVLPLVVYAAVLVAMTICALLLAHEVGKEPEAPVNKVKTDVQYETALANCVHGDYVALYGAKGVRSGAAYEKCVNVLAGVEVL